MSRIINLNNISNLPNFKNCKALAFTGINDTSIHRIFKEIKVKPVNFNAEIVFFKNNDKNFNYYSLGSLELFPNVKQVYMDGHPAEYYPLRLIPKNCTYKTTHTTSHYYESGEQKDLHVISQEDMDNIYNKIFVEEN